MHCNGLLAAPQYYPSREIVVHYAKLDSIRVIELFKVGYVYKQVSDYFEHGIHFPKHIMWHYLSVPILRRLF